MIFPSANRFARSAPAALLILILVLAFALRIYHMDRESVWWDEYATHAHLTAPSLTEFLTLSRTLDPLALPLYYTLEYAAFHKISSSLFVLRLLSVLIGIASIYTVWLLGRKSFGTGAGLFAAAMMTLSPVHIYHAQGIRAYGLFTCLAALMIWSFMKLTEEEKRGHWLLHLVVAAALYWTHPFAVLLAAVPGVYLLIQGRKRLFLLIRWAAAQLLLLLPLALWLFSTRFWPRETTESWLALPGFGNVVADIFFDDIAAFQLQFRAGQAASAAGIFRWIPDLLLAALILLLLAVMLRKMLHSKNSKCPLSLHFLWLVLPPLLLLLLSLVLRPCMFPRYTVHCSLALYLLIGAALTQIRAKWKQWLTGTLLILLMAVQWLWLQPGPQRTDWFSAARLLHDQAMPEDLVLVRASLEGELLCHNYRELYGTAPVLPVAEAESSWIIAAQSALALGVQTVAAEEKKTEPGRVLAFLAMDFFVPGPPLDFEFALNAWGIDFQRWFFPAVQEVYAYALTVRPGTEAPRHLKELLEQWEREGLNFEESRADSVKAFGSLALALIGGGRASEASELLRDMQAHMLLDARAYASLTRKMEDPVLRKAAVHALNALYRGYGFRKNGYHMQALQAFQEAGAFDPDNGVVFYELAKEYASEPNQEAAMNALRQAGRLEEEYASMEAHIQDVMEKGCAFPDAWEAEQAYRRGLLCMSRGNLNQADELLKDCLNRCPKHLAALPERAYVLLQQNRLEESAVLLDRYLQICAAPDARALGNRAIIAAITGDDESAHRYIGQAEAADPKFKETFGTFARLFFVEQHFSEALREVERLKEQGIPFPDCVGDYLRKQMAL